MSMDILRRKWIADLRSGRFKQGVGCLRTEDDEYCCLGVAIPDDMVGVVQFCRYYYNGYAAELPPSVAEALGIDATLMEKLITMMAMGSHLAKLPITWRNCGI
jgi:hypothetical protein